MKLTDIIKQAKDSGKGFVKEPSYELEVEYFQELAKIKEITPGQAFFCFSVLACKGATNSNTPESLSVEVPGEEKEITKRDLVYVHEKVFSNKYIRRLAQKLGTKISELAVECKIPGDLANQINTQVKMNGEPALSEEEKSWTSSFNQDNPDLESRHPRVSTLLSTNYAGKFEKKTKSQEKKGNPRPKPGKPNSAKNTQSQAQQKPGNSGTPQAPDVPTGYNSNRARRKRN